MNTKQATIAAIITLGITLGIAGVSGPGAFAAADSLASPAGTFSTNTRSADDDTQIFGSQPSTHAQDSFFQMLGA